MEKRNNVNTIRVENKYYQHDPLDDTMNMEIIEVCSFKKIVVSILSEGCYTIQFMIEYRSWHWIELRKLRE